jgi:hypothetical protein
VSNAATERRQVSVLVHAFRVAMMNDEMIMTKRPVPLSSMRHREPAVLV